MVLASSLVVPATIVAAVTAMCLQPSRELQSATFVFACHYAGISLMALFLVFGAGCQWASTRDAHVADKVLVYERWWTATMLAPPTAAFVILTSGLRLAFDGGVNDVASLPWLFWLVVGFAFFFFDGLLFYLPEIATRFKSAAVTGSVYRSTTADAMLAMHALSFPVVLGLGLLRPVALQMPQGAAQALQSVCIGCTPAMARLTHAATLVVTIGLVVLGLRVRALIHRIRYLKSLG